MTPDRFQATLAEVRPLADAFTAAGHRLYLVGGIVRDHFLGRDLGPDADIDLTTDARPDAILDLVRPLADAVWEQGARFGTIGCRIGGRAFEVTTHRAEAYTSESRKPEVTFSDAIEADLSRRDFTVNAMALEVPEPRLVDPFDGATDLAGGRLRTPLAPEVSFSDDPLRMMRAARFIAGYGLEPDPDLLEAVRAMAGRLEIVSAERIRDELDKLMVVDDPAAGLWFLHDTGLADQFFPELPAMRLEQDPIHRHKDVLAHTLAVVGKVRARHDDGTPNRITRLAALFHDVGKPKTRSYAQGKGVSFHHHEVVGARMTRERMTALKYSNDDVEAVTSLVELHLRFHTYRLGWTDSAVRRFVRDAGPLLPELIELTRCDCTTRNQRKAATLARRMDELEERIAELEQAEELKALRPDLDGRAVMERLGVPPGPVVGRAMAFLMELRLEEGPLSPDEAGRRLDQWWAAQQPPPPPG
ncbi:MAG TPA: CCA tRNA nucleotidyltransferase [Acidimicrobiales bacterium]|nr:CCA tRNA nucleotidyltransferase [Acidimicrobiales bacterium]